MGMLMTGSPDSGPNGRSRGEPQALSLDEMKLWEMEAREDAERGADVFNEETFGKNAGNGWSFEENVAAVERINEKALAPPPPPAGNRKADSTVHQREESEKHEARHAWRKSRRKKNGSAPAASPTVITTNMQ